MDDKQYVIQEIRRVADAISPKPLTRDTFLKNSSIKEGKIRYLFGTWNRAVEAAGLIPNPTGKHPEGYKRISDDELLKEIGEVWRKIGHRPTRDLMDAEGRFSAKPYLTRWGKFSIAVDKYIEKFGEPEVDLVSSDRPAIKKPKTKSPIVIPQTYKPNPGASVRKTIFFGEPLDFRGLRYAPINEQGVVYLFGVVSHELGFLIESIRTDYPDCEGKRCADTAGTKWEHLRIEFEYKSSNFAEHGHNPEHCDLIVCWLHDWQECPLEVLELRTAIKKLPRE